MESAIAKAATGTPTTPVILSEAKDLQPAIVPDLSDQSRPPKAIRHRLPEERASLTHKFSLAGHEGYITVGLYPSGEPGEIFIRMAKEGSTVSGLMDSFATAVSLALQHGVPLKVLVEKFAHTRFEPSGWTGNEHIGYAKSIMDYIFRWLQLRFLSGHQLSLFSGMVGPGMTGAASGASMPLPNSIPVEGTIGDLTASSALGVPSQSQPTPPSDLLHSPSSGVILSGAPGADSRNLQSRPVHVAEAMKDLYDMGDAPSCHTCGAIMVRNGSCYRCMSCGSTSGCS
jgi:ribonucleoside-diphosphate reductase alpha chain